jgi:hypothetical protein
MPASQSVVRESESDATYILLDLQIQDVLTDFQPGKDMSHQYEELKKN